MGRHAWVWIGLGEVGLGLYKLGIQHGKEFGHKAVRSVNRPLKRML